DVEDGPSPRYLPYAISNSFRNLGLLSRRLRRLNRLMSLRSAMKVLIKRDTAVVGTTLRATSSPCYLRRWSSDLDCLEKVFRDYEYRCPFPIQPRIIVDAGANIGAAAMYFTKVYPSSRIYALEPEP